jgi:glycosyltransferase involved in cell wall biosynthesis
VILVDAGSVDDGAAIAERLTRDTRGTRVLSIGAATPGRGRNEGIRAASNEWIALTDAGIELDRHWLERLWRHVDADETLDAVYGDFEPVVRTFFQRCLVLAYVQPKRPTAHGPSRSPFVASMLVRKRMWEELGQFPDLRAAEDVIFLRRVRESRARTAVASEALAYWQPQPSLRRTFWRFRLFSRHNVLAGQQKYWHYGVARQYAAALPFVALAVARSPRWLTLPALGLGIRTWKSIWCRREGRGLLWASHPARLVAVASIIVTIDVATFVGWAEAIRDQRRRGFPTVGVL